MCRSKFKMSSTEKIVKDGTYVLDANYLFMMM